MKYVHLIFSRFSEACHQGVSPGAPVSSPPSLVNDFSQKLNARINATSTLSNLIDELSLNYQVAHDTLHVICDLCVGHDLHTVVSWPLEHMCWRQLVVQ